MPRWKPWTLELFMDKVRKSDGCWEWTGARDANGYGITWFRLKQERTHRLSWHLHFGAPGALHVLHRCDNPPCVRPDHLFLGTRSDNMRDCSDKGRTPRAKINRDTAEYIRRCCKAGQTQASVAAKHGITPTQVGRIVRGTCWKPARHL